MQDRTKLIIKAIAKKACDLADKQGYSRINKDVYLYSREFIDTDHLKTQGGTDYVLLFEGWVLGVASCSDQTFLIILKNMCEKRLYTPLCLYCNTLTEDKPKLTKIGKKYEKS